MAVSKKLPRRLLDGRMKIRVRTRLTEGKGGADNAARVLAIRGDPRCAGHSGLPMGTRIDLPMFREESGVWRRAITLPDEICGPIGKAVFDALVECGLAVRGPAM
jgi:hypothetical protein